MREIYSFDIFDTVLTRGVAYPADLFEIIQMGLRVLEKKYSELQKIEFSRIRREAEQQVRKQSDKEDVTFGEIYEYLGEKNGLTESILSEIMKIELNCELNFVRPIAWTINEINTLRKQNRRIIFTSDIYLSKNVIIKMLKKYKAYEDGDGIYLSSEIGLTKSSGNLFKYIFKKEEIKPEQLFHFGDNLISDLVIPSRNNINIYKTAKKCIFQIKLFLFLKKLLNCFYRIGVRLFRKIVKKKGNC